MPEITRLKQQASEWSWEHSRRNRNSHTANPV